MNDPANKTFTVRIIDQDGIPVGIGVLVSEQHIITCAHVVNMALGLEVLEQERPTKDVIIDFPFLTSTRTRIARKVRAYVECWIPPPREGAAGDDIAGLRLIDGPAPEGAIAARFAVESPRQGHKVRVFGSPRGRPHGQWVDATIRGVVGDGLLQLDSESELRIRQGFSGSPVFDDVIGRVVGIVALAPVKQQDRDGYAIGADRIRFAWPDVFDMRKRHSARKHVYDSEELTILHLSGTRFGQGLGPTNQLTTQNRTAHQLFGRLHDDLVRLAMEHQLWPDLLVVTGNLTDHGRPNEFKQAAEFLSALAETIELPRRQVAFIPGRHDVNRQACQAYFLDQEAEDNQPVPPFFPKWKHFAAAFAAFYEDVDGATFTPDEPWSLFEMPEIAVVVAGLNSTIKQSHIVHDDHGWVGNLQLERFAARLEGYRERGWLRIVAINHCIGRGSVPRFEVRDTVAFEQLICKNGLVNILLHGGTQDPLISRLNSGHPSLAAGDAFIKTPESITGQYQLITVRRDSFTRYARQYSAELSSWSAGTRHIKNGGNWIDRKLYNLLDVGKVFPAQPIAGSTENKFGKAVPRDIDHGSNQRTDRILFTASEKFYERVADATRARWPDSVITPLPDYLRVTRSSGGFTKQWPVGVVDGHVTHAAVRAFGTGIHAQFASADPHVESQLVYGGPPATNELIMEAQRNGFHLCSFIEYQGLLDLRPLTQAQSERLATDRIYPERLYVPQRFRQLSEGNRAISHGLIADIQPGLIGQTIDWMGADDARLVVVLGDFGRGKTAFLRQLARSLPRELKSPLPVLVELRNLEKAPTLDALLVQHLAMQGVDDINPTKLRYMIRSGRIVLLFDGFDELELRVGYDNAADYLRTLLESVTDRAKVILTSRTQHFRSTEQVRTALGARIETLAASRVVVLEEFSEEQIIEFLTKHYDRDDERAHARFNLIRNIGNLLDLAHNPRILAFIAELDERRLRSAQSEEGQISAADLYREIIDFWLTREAERQQHRGGLQSLGKDERFAACTALALRQWVSKSPTIELNELSDEISNTLTRLTERDYSDEQASHAIGSGSLLVRTDAGAFTFVHQSVMEWLVAAAAADGLSDSSTAQVLIGQRMSRLMADFFTDLAGSAAARDWAERTLANRQATQIGKRNALTILKRTGRSSGSDSATVSHQSQNLAGVDLRDQDLTDRDLRGADLRGANLNGMFLRGTDLFGADLRDADLRGARLVDCSLRGAVLAGSLWDRASLLGVDGLDDSDTGGTLRAAAIAGRDPAVVMIQPPISPRRATFSPDGTLLAIATGNVVQISDAIDGRAIRIIRGHRGDVLDVAFSPDGTLLATASSDRTVRIYELIAGKIQKLSGHVGKIVSMAFSPDGAHLATSSFDRTARIWELASGTTVYTLVHEGTVCGVAFSPDGALIATASEDETARVWDAKTGTVRTTLYGHTGSVRGVAFSPDGALIATASEDETARVWDAKTGTVRTTLYGHTGSVRGVAFSPDGALIATASKDETARLWDLASGTARHTLHGHKDCVNSVTCSPDGTLVATASDDGSARIWDVMSGTARHTIRGRDRWIHRVAYSPDGNLLASASDDNTVRIWDLKTGTTRQILDGHAGWLNDVVFSPDGNLLASASRDRTVRIWDLASGTCRHTLEGHERWVNRVAFSPNGTRVATASDDGTVRTWDAESGALCRTFEGHSDSVLGVAFSPDGRVLATVSLDKTARIWNVNWGVNRRILNHSSSVRDVAFSPDGNLLATGSRDGTVKLWNLGTENDNRFLEGHSASVNGVAFSPDGTMLATASADGTSKLWNLSTYSVRTTFHGHINSVNGIAFSIDGSMLATASSDGTIRISRVSTGKSIIILLALSDGGYATLVADSGYKIEGAPGDALWWSIKLCRFTAGELDSYIPGMQRLPPEAPMLSADAISTS